MNSSRHEKRRFESARGRQVKRLVDDPLERLGVGSLGAILWRNLWLLSSIVVAVMALATIVLFTADRQYVAETAVVLEGRRPTIGSDLRPNVRSKVTASEVMTEVEVIKSRDFAENVVEKLNLVQDETYNPLLDPAGTETISPELSKSAVTAKLLDHYSVSPFRGTLGIGIEVFDTDGARAALIANTIAQVYVDRTLELQRAKVARAVEALEARLASLEEEITASERELAALIQANRLDDRELGQSLFVDFRNSFNRLEYLKEQGGGVEEKDRLVLELEELSKKLSERSKATQERRTQERQIEDLYTRHELLSQNIHDLRVHMDLLAPLARQISVAQPPPEPILPNRNTLLAGSFAGALVFGFVAMLLREVVDGRLFLARSAHPALGLQNPLRFPAFPKSARRSLRRLIGFFSKRRSRHRAVEAVKNIFLVLDAKYRTKRNLQFLVTSSGEDDQAGFVALCLAVAAASEDMKVLYVDFEREPDEALANLVSDRPAHYDFALLLSDAALMAQEVYENAIWKGMDYLRPAADPQVPLDVLGTQQARFTYDMLCDLYDVIIISAPPVNASSIFGRLLPITKNVVLVLRDQGSETEDVLHTFESLDHLGIEAELVVNYG